MKLVPILLYDHMYLPPKKWRFKKRHINGKVIYRESSNDYIYVLEHHLLDIDSECDKGETFATKEEAAKAAENFIELWYSVQGRLLSLK